MKIVLNQERGSNVTVYGAIGACLPGALFLQAHTTNAQNTVLFLERLHTHAGLAATEKLHLVLDNHSAHHTHVVRETMSRLNIEPHYIPPYTPEFNSIEALWGVVKRDVKKKFVYFQSDGHARMQQQEFQTLLQDSLNAVSRETQALAARTNNRDFLYRTLGRAEERAQDPTQFQAREQSFVRDPLAFDIEDDPPSRPAPFDLTLMLAEPGAAEESEDTLLPSQVLNKLPKYYQLSLEESLDYWKKQP